eukprot:1805446-Rhodomonas_salina.3
MHEDTNSVHFEPGTRLMAFDFAAKSPASCPSLSSAPCRGGWGPPGSTIPDLSTELHVAKP